MELSLISFAILLVLIVLRVPIAFAMGAIGFVGFMALTNLTAASSMVGTTFVKTVQNYELSVLPLFILMGNIVSKAGISSELYRAAQSYLGHRRGGLAMATVVAAGGFSAVCGSSLATAATMAKVAMPSMRKYGYSDSLATASIAAGGTLGILIPPSVIMVIYGLMTETSIRELFAAGFLPGLLGIILYMCAVLWSVWRRPDSGPRAEKATRSEKIAALLDIWGVLALFGLVMGGIYLGIFTPTESAGVGAGGAILLGLARRQLNWTLIREVLIDSVRTSATLFFILIGALIFSNFIGRAGLPDGLRGWVEGMKLSPYMVIVLICLIYIALGCILESISMLLLTIPVFFPIVKALVFPDMDPRWVLVWFGVLAVVVTEISLITPPVGLNVYVLSAVLRDVKTTTIFRGIFPFITVDIVRLTIIIFIPQLSLLLPKLFYG
ncbi:MAG: TRAP transporter large permease [Alphaproteobacteria bacterium]